LEPFSPFFSATTFQEKANKMAKSLQRMNAISIKEVLLPFTTLWWTSSWEQSTRFAEQRHQELLRKQQDTVTGEQSEEMW